jgi:hypothetical protein
VTLITESVPPSAPNGPAERTKKPQDRVRGVATDSTAVDAEELDVRVGPGMGLLVEVSWSTRRRSWLGGEWIEGLPTTL